MSETYTCVICGGEFSAGDTYEYRGMYSCGEHFDEMQEKRDFQRQEIIAEEKAKTDCFRGMDLDPGSPVGRANREVLSKQMDIASQESGRLKDYEGRE